jgi:hypothetical protein
MADNVDPQLPQWSSVSGTVDPPIGYKQTGFTPGYKPPAQWVNWIWNRAYLWLVFLRTFLLGNLEWSGHIYCDNYSAPPGSGWQIFVSYIRTYWAGGSILSDVFENGITCVPANVDAADLLTAVGPVYALYPEETYFIYFYRDSGTGLPGYLLSRTTPTTYGWKTGFVGTMRYIGSFKTNRVVGAAPFVVDTGSPIPFVKHGNRYSYFVNAITEPFLKTAVIAVAGPNVVSLLSYTPRNVNCRAVRILVDWDDITVGAVIFSVNGVPWSFLNVGPARTIFHVEMPMTNVRSITLGFQAATVGNFTVTVLGYEEAMP